MEFTDKKISPPFEKHKKQKQGVYFEIR